MNENGLCRLVVGVRAFLRVWNLQMFVKFSQSLNLKEALLMLKMVSYEV